MSRKQEYIARVKYSNTLPPPTIPPKLLRYVDHEQEAADSPQLITSLYTRTNVTPLVSLDTDLAMPMDLMQIPGLLNKNDTSFLYGLGSNIKLNKSDRVLLRDPRVDRVAKTDTSKVSFLRRTEYLSSTVAANATAAAAASSSSHNINNNVTTGSNKRSRRNDEDDSDKILNPSEIVNKVETTFEIMNHDLTKFRHPVKRQLKATKVWDLLPDTASMDQSYFTLRMVGSAALDTREKAKLALNTTIFRPVELEEDEWISMYTTDKKDSEILDQNIETVIDEDTTNTNGNDNSITDDKIFKFKRLRDFDMKQLATTNNNGNDATSNTNNTTPFDEVAIILNDEKKVAYYKPLRSRIELRRRRVNDVLKSLVRENNIDQLNITLRNPTTQEANLRDKLRMKYDPINFVPVDDDEDEEEEENEVEGKEQSTQESNTQGSNTTNNNDNSTTNDDDASQ